MSNQKISSKFLNFHATEVKATVLWDEKKCVAFDTRKQEKKKIKSSKGLITGAVRGKSVL